MDTIAELSVLFPILVLFLLCFPMYLGYAKRWATPMYVCALAALVLSGLELNLALTPPPAQPLFDPGMESIGHLVENVPSVDSWDGPKRFLFLLGGLLSGAASFVFLLFGMVQSNQNHLRRSYRRRSSRAVA
jgi:hypothetical protein